MIVKDAVRNIWILLSITLLCLYKVDAHLKTPAQVENPCQNLTIKTPLIFEHKNTGNIVGRNQVSHIN